MIRTGDSGKALGNGLVGAPLDAERIRRQSPEWPLRLLRMARLSRPPDNERANA